MWLSIWGGHPAVPTCRPPTTLTLGPGTLGGPRLTRQGWETGREQAALGLHSAALAPPGKSLSPGQQSWAAGSLQSQGLSCLSELDPIGASMPSASCQASRLTWTPA